MKRIPLDRLPEFFRAVNEKRSLYLPVDGKSGAEFKRFAEGDVLSDATNTNRSAKDFFFPQTENMARFRLEEGRIDVQQEEIDPEEKIVVFGARACDVKSFEVLDRVFLMEPVDEFYKSRRERAVVVALACTRPEETCFCRTFGIDAADPAGDVSAWKTESEMLFRANTEKGEAFLEECAALLTDGGEDEAEKAKKESRAILDRLPLKDLPLEKWKKGAMMDFFNDPAWEELSRPCLGCGTCTFVCPTCQCFDIRDFDTGHGVRRYRCWDSCMYSDFTLMSAGQPRPTQVERFRQRFMHKLVYYPANNEGLFSCVGCGRCLKKCPVHANIVKVMKEVGGKNDAS
ncbi:MAG: 4Fe-4S dicluster domain-containing protein [Clostridia bacterium]|nr:4Fe-4S dicluster domain-containing protein [Clostridia bacterium]